MQKIYSSQDGLMIGLLRQVLEDHEIRCVVRNEHLAGAMGELPPIECWPELWVLDDADAARARRVLSAVLAATELSGPPWRCPECEEEIEAQFTECWKCGGARAGFLLA